MYRFFYCLSFCSCRLKKGTVDKVDLTLLEDAIRRCFIKRVILESFTNSTGTQMCQWFLIITLQACSLRLCQKQTVTQVHFYEF